MVDLIEVKSPSIAGMHDRRRPGRVEYSDAHLIALLRARQLPDLARPLADGHSGFHLPDAEQYCGDGLGAARGIALGVVLGAVSWTALGAILWLCFVL
jgi:hypothetical protein